ncbi:MAG: UbiD family decarboxylase [Bdellovibrionota bacterium]
MGCPDLRSFVQVLRDRKDIVEINAEVDPKLELAEIHRRVIAEQGPALLFRRVRGSNYPVATNLFGTKDRVDLAFGDEGRKVVEEVARLPIDLVPPSVGKLWQKRSLFSRLFKVGLRYEGFDTGRWESNTSANLDDLPIITSWEKDGGPFFTLPLVYTEHPVDHTHNLGIYRMHKFSRNTTGMHMQIGKGGGFHLARAKELNQKLPLNVFLGGPPAAIVSAIAPLPENVPELLLASLLLKKRLRLGRSGYGPLPFLADAEFVLLGSVDPNELHPEGPFGDHYGYYSWIHDFPVFRCHAMLRRRDAIYPATVVGKPRQEDYFIGNYLQELLSPLFPLVMPAVKDLWSYGETGYHSLAAAVVAERYKREAMVSAFRILGEGQLALTKFLLLVDRPMDLQDFPKVLEYILERADFRTDLYVFSNLSMDTLDYTGPKLNEGSKGVLLGMGDPIRTLPKSFDGNLPAGLREAKVFCPGCLVVSNVDYASNPRAAEEISQLPELRDWPLVILVDRVADATASSAAFLWTAFTRFEPAGDITASNVSLHRFHPLLEPPVVIDARMKPQYPDELFCDPQTAATVDSRWKEYFPHSPI